MKEAQSLNSSHVSYAGGRDDPFLWGHAEHVGSEYADNSTDEWSSGRRPAGSLHWSHVQNGSTADQLQRHVTSLANSKYSCLLDRNKDKLHNETLTIYHKSSWISQYFVVFIDNRIRRSIRPQAVINNVIFMLCLLCRMGPSAAASPVLVSIKDVHWEWHGNGYCLLGMAPGCKDRRWSPGKIHMYM